MKTARFLGFASNAPTVVALGCFDGVHRGHRQLIENARKIALENSLSCCIWSFSEPPKSFFSKSSGSVLTTEEEKGLIMEELGVDIFVSVPFDENIASLAPKEFFDKILIKNMNARHIVCGYNYRFGKGGEGDAELLGELCKAQNIGFSALPEVMLDGVTISSSEIRNALLCGEAERGALMLGRPYSFSSCVIDGQKLGRRLGFPTINQILDSKKQIPMHGVYVSRICVFGEPKYGITNIGVRPTVDGNSLCAETNIFDFSGDLYDRELRVELLCFIRNEIRFCSVEALKKQIELDISAAKEYIGRIAKV